MGSYSSFACSEFPDAHIRTERAPDLHSVFTSLNMEMRLETALTNASRANRKRLNVSIPIQVAIAESH
mgnify:CR=1 FL=1